MSRPRIAAVVTIYDAFSHAQHIVDRFLWGYGLNSRHHHPPMDLVALYVDQVPADDLSHGRARLFPDLKIYPTIAETLTRGGDELAVDGVLLIGEHGHYPQNEGQVLYPRYEFFQEIVQVYRDSGRTASLFNDKHLSWKWEWAWEMVDTAHELGFAFMAGSSLPVAQRLPPIDMPPGAEVEEALCVGPGGTDGFDIHALEALQCMVERRRGGETGVVAVHALQGDAVWQAMQAGSWAAGGWDPELFETCLCRSHTLGQARKGFNHSYPGTDQMPGFVKHGPFAYRVEYADGLKATMLLVDGLVQDCTFAARLKGRREPLSTLVYISPRGVMNTFSAQANRIEKMFRTGKATYPIERTLLTTGLTAAGVESLWLGQKRIETPHLAIRYQPTRESTFWRS